MKKLLFILVGFIVGILIGSTIMEVYSSISKPYTFSAGTVIYSSYLNDDFDTLYNEANRIIALDLEGTQTSVASLLTDVAQIDVNTTDIEQIQGFLNYSTGDPLHALVVLPNATNPDHTIDIDADYIGIGDALVTDVDITIDIEDAGANGLDTGSEATSTTYAVWLIEHDDGDTVAGLLSTSFSSPTMPTDYTNKRLVGNVYNDSSDDFSYLIAYTPSMLQYLIVNDTKTSGTGGGTFEQDAWRTRTLNTVQCNSIIGASLASNQITLPAGTYLIEASAPAFVANAHQSKLYNITDSADAVLGTSENAREPNFVYNRSFVVGVITIAAEKVFEIQHYCATTGATTGFGVASGIASEVYTVVKVTRL